MTSSSYDYEGSYKYEALSRLQVNEGLLITAERWKHAQDYHRHRQNIYYRSVYQPGIVRGFGVQVMPDYPAHPRTFQLRIFRGVAIDVSGNPVVLHCDCRLPILAKPDPTRSPEQPQTIYVVARYQDPESPDIDIPDYIETSGPSDATQNEPPDAFAHSGLQHCQVLEHCQIIQRVKLYPGDIELCRIQLKSNATEIRPATSVYAPGFNCLDLTHRQIAKPLAQGRVKVSQLYFDARLANSVALSFQRLFQSAARLYPSLERETAVISVAHQTQVIAEPDDNQEEHLHPNNNHLQSHLTYVPYDSIDALSNLDIARLKQQLQAGGVLLVTVDPNIYKLRALLEQLSTGAELLAMPPVLEARSDNAWQSQEQWNQDISRYQKSIEEKIENNLKTIAQQMTRFLRRLEYPHQGNGLITSDHPLRNFPFAFPNWPSPGKGDWEARCWGAIVLVYTHSQHDHSQHDTSPMNAGPQQRRYSPKESQDPWGIEMNVGQFSGAEAPPARQSFRTTHEWGINLLHYAWEHHRLTQLQQGRCTRE